MWTQNKKKEIIKSERGSKTPTAPSATKRYTNGTLDYGTKSNASDHDLIITAPDGSTIRREIISWPNTDDLSKAIRWGLDTIYTEIPGHRFWVTPKPRIEKSSHSFDGESGFDYYFKTDDADIMKRRWNEAIKVSKDKRKK